MLRLRAGSTRARTAAEDPPATNRPERRAVTGPAYALVMVLGLTMAALLEIARLVLSVLA